MMKTEKDKVKKKVWEKPMVNVLRIKMTYGGNTEDRGESIGYVS